MKHRNLHASESPVVTAEQMRECLRECSPDTREYVQALADELPDTMVVLHGKRANFGTGSALELIGAMIKIGVI